MEPLNRVGGSQCLPLLFREPEERQELLAAFPQARHHTRGALGPGALEERVGSASRLSIGRVDDSMEVVADLGKRVFGRFALEVAQLVGRSSVEPQPSATPTRPRVATRRYRR